MIDSVFVIDETENIYSSKPKINETSANSITSDRIANLITSDKIAKLKHERKHSLDNKTSLSKELKTRRGSAVAIPNFNFYKVKISICKKK